MLTAAGIGSGLDIESIISQLMVLEARPLERLEAQKSDVEVEISANGQLRGSMSRLQVAVAALADSESLGGVTGTSSDEDVLTVSADASAETQSHEIEVIQLATTHRMSSSAFADADTEVGSGTLDLTVDGNTLSLELSTGNNTLTQIRDAINSAADNPGVTASIITVDAGAQLIVTANDTGTANQVTITPDASLTSGGFTFTQVGVVQDALVRVDGFDLTSGSNTLSNVIQGATVELYGAGIAGVSFGADSGSIADGIEEMVNAFNDLRGSIKALRQGPLAGDSILLSLESRIFNELSNPITLSDSSTAYLFELGVSFNDAGDLTFDSSDLDAAVGADPLRVLDMFAAVDTGLGARLENLLLGYTQENGVLDERVGVLEDRTRSLDQQLDNAQFRLEKTEERLRAEFTALDAIIAQLSVTSDFLSQQLSILPQYGTRRS